MSDNNEAINRRIFMKRLGSAFLGASALGGSMYAATAYYQKEIAITDAKKVIKEMPQPPLTAVDMNGAIAGSATKRFNMARDYGLMGAWFGGIVGYFQYDWQLPDPFSPELD